MGFSAQAFCHWVFLKREHLPKLWQFDGEHDFSDRFVHASQVLLFRHSKVETASLPMSTSACWRANVCSLFADRNKAGAFHQFWVLKKKLTQS
jgi:hypothetical protein